MGESDGLRRLRLLAARRRRINDQIDALLAELLSAGEFIEDIATALDESRENVRRFRIKRGIPDAREIRRAQGAAARRTSPR